MSKSSWCHGSSVHGISQARILEWVAISYSKGSFWPRDWNWICFPSSTGRWFLYLWATWEAPYTHFVVVQSPSYVRLFATPWTTACQASVSLTISQSLPKFMSIASVRPSGHLIPWCSPLLLPSIFPSIRDFSNELAVHIRWPKYWCFSINPSNEYSRLIFIKIDWFDLCTVQGTLRSLLQQHSLKASILWHSAFFMVQLLQPYMITEKTIVLTIQTFVGRVISLLFNTLSRFVIAFLPRNNRLLIWWLQPPSTVILEPKKRKSVTASIFSPSTCHKVIGPDVMILAFLIFSFRPAFSLSSFTLIKKFFSYSSLSAIKAVLSTYLRFIYYIYITGNWQGSTV